MANTITTFDKGVCLTAMDTDWTWTDTFTGHSAGGVRITSIQLCGNYKASLGKYTNEYLCIKDGSESGATLFFKTTSAYDINPIVYYGGARFLPFLDISSCSVSTGAQLVILFK